MHRIDGAGHVSGQFVNEDAATNRPPTEITPEWLSAVQNELITVIESSGLALDKANNGQLLAALKGGGLFDTQAASDSSRKVATTAFVHGLLAALPGDKFLQGLSSYNAATNVMTLAMSDGSTVNVDMTNLINDAIGSIAVATTTNDASFADNSSKPASTGWMRGAMSAIATAAGFSYSFTANGYFKLPSWFLGFTIQWCAGSSSAIDSSQSITFPISFANACLVVVPITSISVADSSANVMCQLLAKTISNCTIYVQNMSAGSTSVTPIVISFGY